MSETLAKQPEWAHFIAGAYVPAADGGLLDEFDPRSGKPSFRIARGGAEDVARAVDAAWRAQAAWADLRPMERGRVLYALAQGLRENKALLAEIDQHETGRPVGACLFEVELAAQYFEFYAGLVNAHQSQVVELGSQYHSYTRHEPFGVVGIITPWNAPLGQAARGIAPALATGNAVVAKPSEFTSVTLLAFARIAVERGLPAGLLNVVTGTGPEAGAALVAHEGIRKVAFTGSVRAGQEIGKMAAERIIPLGLELGGKSPNIVFEDADMAQAVSGAIKAFTVNSGQVCSAGTRLLVHRSLHDRFVEGLKDGLKNVPIGSGPADMMGPIITGAQYEKVRAYGDVARAEGAEVFVGGKLGAQASDEGWFVQPLVCTGVNNDMRIAREEVFGPVLSVIPFDTEEEAVELANDTEYGLVAGVWTTSLARAHRVAAKLQAGQIFVNEYFAGGVETPFGGYKKSGYGREKGVEALNHYTQLKSVTIRL